MADSAIVLSVLISVIVANGANGFKLNLSAGGPLSSQVYQGANFQVQPYQRSIQNVDSGPIAGHPKVPPPNAFEAGGHDDDLLPPFEDSFPGVGRSLMLRRSAEQVDQVDHNQEGGSIFNSKIGYPFKNNDDTNRIPPTYNGRAFDPNTVNVNKRLPISYGDDALDPLTGLPFPSWKFLSNQKTSENGSLDPKTGYPLKADASWKYAGGDDQSLQLPLETQAGGNAPKENEEVDPKTGYPLRAQSGWSEAGGNSDILQLPLEDSNVDVKVDPKTGYPLLAETSWSDAGGNGDILQPPAEDSDLSGKVDPKTGYPLLAEASWSEAGGTGDILQLPLEDGHDNVHHQTGNPQVTQNLPSATDDTSHVRAGGANVNIRVDPKTGYPLQAENGWSQAGGTGDILQPPLEDSSTDVKVDPKTGYPLQAESGWKDAGGTGDILELPVDDTNSAGKVDANVDVDPKTGYPLVAESWWKDAGGNGDILQVPLPTSNDQEAVDPKTGYPLLAQPNWKDAGGDGQILVPPPVGTNNDQQQGKIDPKTGYPLTAQPDWADAGGNGDILQLPVADSSEKGKVDPKTGYPLTAEPGWSQAGGDGSILELPRESGESTEDIQPDVNDLEAVHLTELRPPAIGTTYSSGYQDVDVKPSQVPQISLQNSGQPSNGFLSSSSNPTGEIQVRNLQPQSTAVTQSTPLATLKANSAPTTTVSPDKFSSNGLHLNELIAAHGSLFHQGIPPSLPTFVIHRTGGVQPTGTTGQFLHPADAHTATSYQIFRRI